MCIINIRNWDNYNDIYSWNGQIWQKVSSYSTNLNTEGFVKYFIYGKTVIVFKINDNWFIHVNGNYNNININDIKKINFRQFSFFDFVSLETNKKAYHFIDFSMQSYFVKNYDPTYDSLEQESTFAIWLQQLNQSKNPETERVGL